MTYLHDIDGTTLTRGDTVRAAAGFDGPQRLASVDMMVKTLGRAKVHVTVTGEEGRTWPVSPGTVRWVPSAVTTGRLADIDEAITYLGEVDAGTFRRALADTPASDTMKAYDPADLRDKLTAARNGDLRKLFGAWKGAQWALIAAGRMNLDGTRKAAS